VSTGRRFVFRELTLSRTNPTAYVYDGRTLPMTTEAVSVDVLQDDGTIQAVDHTFYMTRFGAVLVIPPILNWNRTTAYALTDVNLDNSRTFAEFREMGRARTVDEFSQVLRKYVGLPWVNTVAADSQGNAFYADMTVVPHVTNAQLADEDCKGSPITQPLAALRMFTLNGSLPKCDPGTDADAPVAGIFGPGNLPSLVRRDYVQNSNMSYWLTNPNARLEGYSRLIGDDENQPQNFRTRLGITQIRDRMAGADGLPGTGFDRQWMQDVLFENRHYSAEIMLDDVLTLCATEDPIVIVDGTPVNVTEACDVLAAWDRRNKTASVGPHVWTEFWKRAMTPPSTDLYEVPFDPADPVNTPRGVRLSDPAVRARLMHDLGGTVKYFADNLIPLGREWGEVQFDTRNGERIPIHGGSVASGVYNGIITSPLVKGLGYTQVLLGSSYIQAVTWTPRGPDARALVTYSQSTDPENPHYADQTKLFSGYGWVDMPFAEGDIRRDPNLTSMQLREKR
jgi:acyl-homoserine-lactone acylase